MNYESLISFLIAYNKLAPYSELSWEILNDHLYIDGNPTSLANLFSLLWTATNNYCFYFCFRNCSSMIEVIQINRD